MRLHICKTKHWELCKCTDRLIDTLWRQFTSRIQTGAILKNSLDKSNHERRAEWSELYEVQQTSELYEQRSGINLNIYAKFLEIKLNTFDYHENKTQITID